MKITGAEIIIESLKAEGVEILFGYPGGSVLHIYDALYKQEDIEHVLVRHEQAATHAADGYARASGKPGVVLVTSGPGATNAITGIANAYMDSIPMVVISGQVPRELIGNDAFQEVDMVGVSRSVVKHNFLVTNVENLATTIARAFYVATHGRPGPVVVDIPKDITAAKCTFSYPSEVVMRTFSPTTKGHTGQIKKAVKRMLEAKRPIFYTGGGVILNDASSELRELVTLMGFPITNTLMGLGSFSPSSPQYLGMLGMHGTYEANMAMHDADLIIAIGARFDDRITARLDTFSPGSDVIHVDIDPSSISKNISASIPIVGPCKGIISEMTALAKKFSDKIPNIDDWWKQIGEWRSVRSLDYNDSSEVIKPQKVIQLLHEVTKGDAYVTSDVGQHQMWAAQYYPFEKPRRWINSGGLGTMGFGFPAAMGVKLAYPDAEVACVTGEGSIQMMLQELSTCSQYNAPVKILNLNNRYLGMVRQWQEFFYDRRYSMSYMESLPDFVKLVESYGHVGMYIDNPKDLRPAMEEAFAMKDRLVFMDIITDQTENVFPMIPSGASHNEMKLYTDFNQLENNDG